MMEIGVGIIGYGEIGRVHRKALDQVRGVRLVAVATHGPVEVPGVRLYHSYESMLADPDVVVVAVCTPNGAHARHALDALAAGKHVVVEKPLALDIAAGHQVVEEARRRELILTVVLPRRLAPPSRAVFDALQHPAVGRRLLGEVQVRWSRDQAYYDAADWRGSEDLDGGVLLNQAIHYIDLLHWLMGPVAEVRGITATLTHRIEADDCAVAAVRFRSGALGTISATTCAPIGLPGEVNLFCEHAYFSLDDRGISRWEAPFPMSPLEPEQSSGAQSAGDITGIGHIRLWTEVVSALQAGRGPEVTGEAALASTALALAVRRSWRENRPVKPEYIED